MKYHYIVYILLILLNNSCIPSNEKNSERPIVSIGDWVLTDKQLQMSLPSDINSDDSVALTEDYIGRWIRTRLFLYQAEINLAPEERNIQELLDEYRTSLLVHLYQQKMLEDKHQPIVSEDEIKSYHKLMADNFKLQENIVRGVFLVVNKNAPNQDELVRLLKSKSSDDLVTIDAYAFQYASIYDQFIEEWIPFSKINLTLNRPIVDEAGFLRYNNFYQTSDSLNNYYFSKYDYRLIGQESPLPYVQDRIEAILLNKKRIEFISKLGEELYEEAIHNKIVHFH